MTKEWRFTKSLPTSGYKNMQLDQQLFDDFEVGSNLPTLRVYAWNPPCISVGYNQDMEKSVDIYKAFDQGWEIVKRPTGGGLVFHNMSEVSYSVVTDINALAEGLINSYVKISEALAVGFSKLGIDAHVKKEKVEIKRPDLCFSYPTEYELVVNGKKLVGSAQKRGKRTLLQQGSIFIRHDYQAVLHVLKKPVDKDFYSKCAISAEEILGRVPGFEEVADAIKYGFEQKLGVSF
ncbi:biotin/lipoate A/B protein ligase family protein [Candidatus Margulisiibacteriota bacterium]